MATDDPKTTTKPDKPRLMTRVEGVMRLKHYSRRTAKAYRRWIVRYIHFHDKRHPGTLASAEVT
jgi:hypothetical protein